MYFAPEIPSKMLERVWPVAPGKNSGTRALKKIGLSVGRRHSGASMPAQVESEMRDWHSNQKTFTTWGEHEAKKGRSFLLSLITEAEWPF